MLRLALHWQILIAMLIGAVVGVVLNAFAGEYVTQQRIDYEGGRPQLLGMAASIELPPTKVWASDSPERVLIQIDELVGGSDRVRPQYRTRRLVVGEPQFVEAQRVL